MLRNPQGVDEFDHIAVAVASYERRNESVPLSQLVICLEQQSFDSLLLLETEEVSDLFDRLRSRSVHLLERLHLVSLLRIVSAVRALHSRRHVALRAVSDLTLAVFRKSCEFVRSASSDSSVVRLYRSVVEAAAVEDLLVSAVHIVVALVESFVVEVERVSILHDELAAPHETESGPHLITVLRLDLIKTHRKLLVARYVRPHDIGEYLFMRRSEAEVSALPVLYSPQLGTVIEPSSRILPQLSRLDGAHQDLLSADSVHLFPDDLLDLSDRSVSEIHVSVDTRCQLSDHACPEEQDVAGQHRFARRFSECFQVHF